MRACTSLALLACVALLLGAGSATAAAADPCSAEEGCEASNCGSSYAHPASHFPYSVDYTTTGDSVATTFIFKVCSTECLASDPLCKPLKSFRLRLADGVLASPAEYIKMANPEGTVNADCSAAGPGWFIQDGELLSLATHNPAQGEVCEVFVASVYNPVGATEPMPLSELCQQDVKIVEADGSVVFDQAASGASCLFTLELADGTSGVGTVGEDVPPPTPSPPAAKPSPPSSPGPSPYYGARRLQQASGSVRGLLMSTQYYGPSGRRLSRAQAVPETLAFATRRLMEASSVPLPLRLVGSDSAHRSLLGASEGVLGATGRQLSGYYGARRSMLSVGQETTLGATGRQLSGYYRRSMLSVGQDATIGATGRQLSGYYRRSMLSVGQDATIGASGRQLSGYYGARRSMLSVSQDATIGASGRQLSGYYGARRNMLSVGQDATIGASGRQLSGYYRRSMLSVGQDATIGATGRQLAGYYGARRSMLSVGMEGAPGTSGRQLSYYGQRRSMMSVGQDGSAGRVLASYYR